MTDEQRESARKAQETVLLMDYNEAYYRLIFGPEKDYQANKDRLAKMRSLWFSI
jgi:hypothetical protein